MVVAAVAFTVLLLFAGLALDFGRAHLLRSELQTALDAAALAGALEVVPMATIERDRWVASEATCTDPVTGLNYPCLAWSSTSPATATGTESQVLKNNAWLAATAAQCAYPYRCGTYRVVKQWQEMPPSTSAKAQEAFQTNARWQRQDVQVSGFRVEVNAVTHEVTTTATMTMPTSFLRLVGMSALTFTRTGGATPTRL